MPIANLQTYRSIALRVRSTVFGAQGLATFMENAVAQKLKQKCGFATIQPAAQGPADVILDLTITKHARGGDGWIRNENQVVMDTLLVLSDGQDGDLLGTASIHGKSSGTVVNNAPQENEAIDVIAGTVADVLWKSGCGGPRIARAPVPVPDPGPGTGSGSAQPGTGSAGPATPDESRRAEAEGINNQGKEKLFAADTAGALALFQQANSVLPDPKYQFNVCLAFGAMERWDDATAACRQARAMNPSEKLAAKIDQRLEGLKQRQ